MLNWAPGQRVQRNQEKVEKIKKLKPNTVEKIKNSKQILSTRYPKCPLPQYSVSSKTVQERVS